MKTKINKKIFTIIIVLFVSIIIIFISGCPENEDERISNITPIAKHWVSLMFPEQKEIIINCTCYNNNSLIASKDRNDCNCITYINTKLIFFKCNIRTNYCKPVSIYTALN